MKRGGGIMLATPLGFKGGYRHHLLDQTTLEALGTKLRGSISFIFKGCPPQKKKSVIIY